MENLDLAKTTLLENNYSIVLVKNNKIVHTSNKNGLAPLLDLYADGKSTLEGAYVADKVIGKAAALILLEANIKKLYADLISENAISVFDKANIDYQYDKKVKEIRNRDNTGMCPMEKLAQNSQNANELVKKIKEKFNKWIPKN